jgi:hypothetical protein
MVQTLSKNAGAKVVIHDPTLPPLPDEYGIDMRPNTGSSIAVQTVSNNLISHCGHLFSPQIYFFYPVH